MKNGGEGGIRTPGTVSRTPVFKTGAFNHSATSPTTTVLLQSAECLELKQRCSFVCNRLAGRDPGVQWFQDRCHQPLGHLSGYYGLLLLRGIETAGTPQTPPP